MTLISPRSTVGRRVLAEHAEEHQRFPYRPIPEVLPRAFWCIATHHGEPQLLITPVGVEALTLLQWIAPTDEMVCRARAIKGWPTLPSQEEIIAMAESEPLF